MGATLISSNKVTMDDLSEIEVPNQTHSYVPVSHVDFINNTKNIADRILDKLSYIVNNMVLQETVNRCLVP